MADAELERESPLFDKSLPIRVEGNGASGHAPHEITSDLTIRVLRGAKTIHGQRQALLHIEITDEREPFFIYTLQVTETDFHDLKNDQSLLVDFASFPPKFIELLDAVIAASGEELPHFVAVLDVRDARLRIVETNNFKHLTHLALQFCPGTDASIKAYLAGRLRQTMSQAARLRDSLDSATERLASRESDGEQLRMELERARRRTETVREECEMGFERKLSEQREAGAQALSKAVSEAAQNVRLTQERSAARVSELEAQLAELRAENGSLRESGYALETTKRDFEGRIETLSASESANAAELRELRSTNAEFKASSIERERHVTKLEMRLSALQQQVLDKEEVLSKTVALLDAARERQGDLDASSSLHRASNEKLQRKLELSVREIHKGNEVLGRMQAEIKQARSKIKTKTMVIRQQEAVVMEHKAAVETSEREAAQLRQQLKTEREGAEALRRSLAESQTQVNESARLLEANQNVIAYLNREINEASIGGIKSGAFSSSAEVFRPSTSYTGGVAHRTYASPSPSAYMSATDLPGAQDRAKFEPADFFLPRPPPPFDAKQLERTSDSNDNAQFGTKDSRGCGTEGSSLPGTQGLPLKDFRSSVLGEQGELLVQMAS